MILRMLLLMMISWPAMAIDWACPSSKPPIKLSRFDLIQVYSGQPVLVQGAWLIGIMYPASNPETQLAFSELGISPQAAERLAKTNGLVDRNIKLASTPTDMIVKLKTISPSVGYGLVLSGDGIESCH